MFIKYEMLENYVMVSWPESGSEQEVSQGIMCIMFLC